MRVCFVKHQGEIVKDLDPIQCSNCFSYCKTWCKGNRNCQSCPYPQAHQWKRLVNHLQELWRVCWPSSEISLQMYWKFYMRLPLGKPHNPIGVRLFSELRKGITMYWVFIRYSTRSWNFSQERLLSKTPISHLRFNHYHWNSNKFLFLCRKPPKCCLKWDNAWSYWCYFSIQVSLFGKVQKKIGKNFTCWKIHLRIGNKIEFCTHGNACLLVRKKKFTFMNFGTWFPAMNVQFRMDWNWKFYESLMQISW